MTSIKAAKDTIASIKAAQRRVKDTGAYFIKRGQQGWFRPNATGYTDDVGVAGIFLGVAAKGYLSAEGIVLVPVQDMTDTLLAEIRLSLMRAANLTETLADFNLRQKNDQ